MPGACTDLASPTLSRTPLQQWEQSSLQTLPPLNNGRCLCQTLLYSRSQAVLPEGQAAPPNSLSPSRGRPIQSLLFMALCCTHLPCQTQSSMYTGLLPHTLLLRFSFFQTELAVFSVMSRSHALGRVPQIPCLMLACHAPLIAKWPYP